MANGPPPTSDPDPESERSYRGQRHCQERTGRSVLVLSGPRRGSQRAHDTVDLDEPEELGHEG